MIVWIILPVFNEEHSIPLMFPKIKNMFREKGLDYRIVVVEDGSTDCTAQVLKKIRDEYPLEIVTHKMNRGLGETERDGFEYIAEHAGENDIIVRLDCDDTHEPRYIFALIDKLNEGYDVVNTSRFQPGGGQRGVNVYRALISYAANVFMKIMFNIHGVKDYSCGYRAYRVKIIKDTIKVFGNGFIQLKGLGFTSTLEIIVKIKLMGGRFAEVPFELRYDKKASPSKMVTSITTLGYFTMALLYHWPFGGWKKYYNGLSNAYEKSLDEALKLYGRQYVRRSSICQIGG